ncbi:MAG: restriction endonuclease subunit S [Lactobacillus amylovorus]|nr:restriction endonuclease subunit S [Lactobacillus amylovorus]
MTKYKLENIATLKYGKLPDKNKISAKKTKMNKYPIFTGYKVTGYYPEYIFSDSEVIVVARGVGGTGDVKLSPKKAFITNLSIVIQVDKKIVNKKYLQLLLNSMNLRRLDSGSAQSQITITHLKSFEVDLPPKDIQDKIADKISLIERKMQLNKQINANLDELLSAIYNHLVGDKNHNAKLSDICFISNRKISVSDLQLNNYWSNTNLLPDKAGAKIADKLPKAKNVNKVEAGDILFGNIRPYFKKIMYASYNGGASTDVVCFHPNNSAISEFLYSIIYSDKFISSVVRSAKGTKMPRGDKKQMMSYKVYLPTKEEIESFHKQANVILQQKQSNNVENEHLQELKKILLKRLF